MNIGSDDFVFKNYLYNRHWLNLHFIMSTYVSAIDWTTFLKLNSPSYPPPPVMYFPMRHCLAVYHFTDGWYRPYAQHWYRYRGFGRGRPLQWGAELGVIYRRVLRRSVRTRVLTPETATHVIYTDSADVVEPRYPRAVHYRVSGRSRGSERVETAEAVGTARRSLPHPRAHPRPHGAAEIPILIEPREKSPFDRVIAGEFDVPRGTVGKRRGCVRGRGARGGGG